MHQYCGSAQSAATNSFQELELDRDQMSEAEESDYEAGLWGVQICGTCRAEFDYGI